jgi:hypothetical protein
MRQGGLPRLLQPVALAAGAQERDTAGHVAGVPMTTSSSPTTNEMRTGRWALSAVGCLRGGGKAPRRLGVAGILPRGGPYF